MKRTGDAKEKRARRHSRIFLSNGEDRRLAALSSSAVNSAVWVDSRLPFSTVKAKVAKAGPNSTRPGSQEHAAALAAWDGQSGMDK
jgi:hypothetical protein